MLAVPLDDVHGVPAAGGIERNTRAVSALDDTIATATDLLGVAGSVERKLDTAASALEQRTR